MFSGQARWINASKVLSTCHIIEGEGEDGNVAHILGGEKFHVGRQQPGLPRRTAETLNHVKFVDTLNCHK